MGLTSIRERPSYTFSIVPAPLIGRRLRQGTGQRVEDAQPRQRHEIIELGRDAPEEAPSHPSAIARTPAVSNTKNPGSVSTVKDVED